VKDQLFSETEHIAVDRNRGKLGKMMLRPSAMLFTFIHYMFAVAPRRRGDRARLLDAAGNVEYNLLHFRKVDWDFTAKSSRLYQEYNATRAISRAVRQRMIEMRN